MKLTTAVLLSIFILSLGAPARGQGPAQAAAAQRATTQALPLAPVPEPVLVPAGIAAPADPRPVAERALEAEMASAADAPDDPAMAAEIDKDSAELEDMRKAEEASKAQLEAGKPLKHVPGAGRIALIPELDHDLAQLKAEYDIPIEVNESVVRYIRFFQSRLARPHFVKWLGRSHRYMDRYRALLREQGLPQDTVFLAMIESGFGNFAYSRARASGPWQFIAATGKLYGLKQDFWVDERRDPEKSARAAARYLKTLYEQTGDWRLAWAGYNAGVGRIFKAKQKGYDDFWEMAATRGRKVLRAETKGYVPKLMAAAIITKHPEEFGFRADEIEKWSWNEYEEVQIPSAALLSVIAKAAGVSEKDIIDLNPELRRACTPPRPYQLKIPKGQAQTFAQSWPALQDKIRMTFAGHVVQKGDTIASIAHRYGVPAQGILEMNGLRSATRLRLRQELVIPKPTGGAAVAARTPEPEERRDVASVRPRSAKAARPAAPAAPAAASAAAAPEGAKTRVRVQPGDTLWSISRRFGVEMTDLCRWNGIENPRRHKLLVGAHLVVYERG
jgi:membrane-bound lytic murein transglycosylase D